MKAQIKVLGNNWKSATFEFGGQTYIAEAKVYAEPSHFGINDGRVSKLAIWPAAATPQDGLYHYDRGLDFDKTPDGLLEHTLQIFGN